MHQSFGLFFGSSPVRLLLLYVLLAASTAISLADDATHLRDVIYAYADKPGDTLILHARVVPGIDFDPETFSRHKNIAFDAVDISKVGHEINADAKPKYDDLTLCVANLNQLSSSQCKDWSSYWSQPVWDANANRSCQRGKCSIVLLVSSGRIREPECAALPHIHLKKISVVKNGCRGQGLDSSTCRSPVFDLTADYSARDVLDPRLELVLNEQLDLHHRILGTKSREELVRPFPTEVSDLKYFFVGQEHIMSELQDILSIRQFDEGGNNSKVLVLVFAGISGTGKTMLAKLIAQIIHKLSGDEVEAQGKYFRQDMNGWRSPEDSDALFGVKQASLAFFAAVF